MYPFPTKYVSTRKHAALRSRSIVVRRASKESHLHRRFLLAWKTGLQQSGAERNFLALPLAFLAPGSKHNQPTTRI